MASDKTEKATPKKREESRQQGQVARSIDVNGAAVLMAGILVLGATGPRLVMELRDALVHGMSLMATPEVVDRNGLGKLLAETGRSSALAVAPIIAACLVAGVLANVAQVRLRLTPKALQPKFAKINPVQGAKNLFGPNAVFEAGKSIAKIAAVGAVAAYALLPKLDELAGMVGTPPAALGAAIAGMVLDIAKRAGLAYLVIAAVDYVWQRHRHEKQMRMDKQEVKDEGKQQNLPPEVKGAIRRRQIQAARARMMAAVSEADVVVTNPTHFSVALKYDGSGPAPMVVAKGQDLIALRIREGAAAAGVPVVPDAPLARSLYATVEVGEMIPEELYQAVAELLAFVYRVAGRRAAA